MQRVEKPEDVIAVPGEPWTVRLKYTTVAELISDYEQSNALIGRTFCPVLDYMRAHSSEPVENVEAHIYTHPQWGPVALAETMHRTLIFNNSSTEHGEFTARWVQHFCALALAKHDFANSRSALTAMLKHPDLRFYSHEALYVILAYINANHPNPKRALTHPEVVGHLPSWLDLTDFPCPDFPEVSTLPVTGQSLDLPPKD
jgi:hypothetical protein